MSESPNRPPSLKHELRTPLNHIIGYCEMLAEEARDRSLTQFLPDLERIHAAGRRLLTVVNDICDPEKIPIFRADPGLLDHEVRTPLNQVIGYAELLQEEALEAGNQTMEADLVRIQTAARTLLHTIQQAFAPSAISVPTALAPKSIPGPVQPPAGQLSNNTGCLLIVDDDEGNREMLARRLERLGHRTAQATNGREALARLKEGSFDLMLLDIQMPEMDGYQVLAALRTDATWSELPVIVLSASDDTAHVATCVQMGAEDYLPKPFDPILLRARIGACLEKKYLRQRERESFAALQRSQQALSAQLAEAARYVRSLLPAPISTGPVHADWRFQPSDALGGDAFGYHWLDPNHFVFYVLDVCGHGVGAALLSVSVMNLLNNCSMPDVNFRDPSAVLRALNRTFTMEKQNNMYFTIWYGVLALPSMELSYACGGHPPAVLLTDAASPRLLKASGAIVGFDEVEFETRRLTVPRGCRVHVFSDGVYELVRKDGSTVQLPEFVAQLEQTAREPQLDSILRWAAGIRTGGGFEDDVSLLQVEIR